MGEKSWKGWASLQPSDVHPPQPTCPAFFEEWHRSRGQSPGRLAQQRGARFGAVLGGEKWVYHFRVFFSAQKTENKTKYRTASARTDGEGPLRASYPTRSLTHTPVHEPSWPKSSQNLPGPNVLFDLISLKLKTKRQPGLCFEPRMAPAPYPAPN